MVHEEDSDLQCAFHLMTSFLKDLNRAIIQQELFNSLEVPQLYTALYPAPALSDRGLERNKTMTTTPLTEMVEDLAKDPAEDWKDPLDEVMISKTPFLKAATRNRQKVSIPIKIRLFSSWIDCRFSNSPRTQTACSIN